MRVLAFSSFSLWIKNVSPVCFVTYTAAVGTFRSQVWNLLAAESFSHTFHTWRAQVGLDAESMKRCLLCSQPPSVNNEGCRHRRRGRSVAQTQRRQHMATASAAGVVALFGESDPSRAARPTVAAVAAAVHRTTDPQPPRRR